ncbi:MAG: ATP-binding protein [Flavobacteriales bacterium]|nr:Anti-sigma F factor [Flavobacteriales bacterium]MBX2959010.1 ATP-binding protein [Flavobacteriales bacterium]MCL4856116.1 ATP-binding protein [Flavobacteriales bacterium]HRN40459.1 ATP-binding protein [Vicingus sp.]
MSVLEHMSEQLEFESKLNNINRIEKLIDEVCEKHAINEDYYGNMLIALTEAVNNAIVHGNKQDPSKHVYLSCKTKQNEVLFIVKDEGFGFDFAKIPDPTKPENIGKLNGRGVFLMKNLADEVVFEDNGTTVKLKFTLSIN